jgi:hypothetical protein
MGELLLGPTEARNVNSFLRRDMNRTLCIVLVMIASSGLGQTTPKIAELYDRLIRPSETNAAAPEILEMARNDSKDRDFLVGKLPSLVVDLLPPRDARTGNPVWLNAVRLVGQLKIVEAIPALTQGLSRQEMGGGYDDKYHGGFTMGAGVTLGYDIVGRALADIGDPSVSVLADNLSNGDFPARRRAIWILWNVNSPAARKIMRDHLPTEIDPRLSGLIENLLLRAPE